MSSYSLDEIIKRWGLGQLTANQAIGQVLLVVQDLSARVGAIERQLEVQRNGKGGESSAQGGK